MAWREFVLTWTFALSISTFTLCRSMLSRDGQCQNGQPTGHEARSSSVHAEPGAFAGVRNGRPSAGARALGPRLRRSEVARSATAPTDGKERTRCPHQQQIFATDRLRHPAVRAGRPDDDPRDARRHRPRGGRLAHRRAPQHSRPRQDDRPDRGLRCPGPRGESKGPALWGAGPSCVCGSRRVSRRAPARR